MNKGNNVSEKLNNNNEAAHETLETIKDTIAWTMEKLALVLDRSIDSIGKFGIKMAEQIKRLSKKFKEYLLADKEIILHSNLKNMLQELNTSLDKGDDITTKNPKKLYGMLQRIGDLIESRRIEDPSYEKNFAWLYDGNGGIKEEKDKAISKLRITA